MSAERCRPLAAPMKACRACGAVKPPADFHLRRRDGTARRARCRDCERRARRAYGFATRGRSAIAGPRNAARCAVRRAVAAGRLRPARELACAHCRAVRAEHYHHLSYEPDRRLDVVPLCRLCHARAHRATAARELEAEP